jgi:ABC-type polysaccharide/polyol phosphate export permease
MVSRSQIAYYDSDVRRRPLISEARNLWDYRGLVRLLVVRDLTVRYKRSTLGVWWTLLNPLLAMVILWIVFGQIFRFSIPGVPYVVYLLSGIIFFNFFSQGVNASGSGIVNSSSILTKVSVPPEVFSVSAAAAAGANLLVSLIPLLLIQLATGTGIPWTVILTPLPILCLLGLVAGLGLLVASAAVYFYDVLDLTVVVVSLLGYLTPTFYPVDIVPESLRWLIVANPLYSYLEIFRGFVYQGVFAPTWMFVVMVGTSLVVLLIGAWVFSRSWKNLVVLL